MNQPAPIVIDDFLIIEKLAESEWGELFKVKPRNLERYYALKLSREGAAEHRLLTELKVLEKLGGHPNITEVYFTGEYQGRPYIVEDLAETSLRAVLDKTAEIDGRLSFDVCLGIIKQLLEATQAAHDKGIIHRDLKPENILLTSPNADRPHGDLKNYLVQICDFGLANETGAEGIESSLEDATKAAGTVQYLSPEQRHGEEVDHRSDLYTIGLIFYELLTRRKPGINLTKPTEIVTALPIWIDDFILRCLKDQPKDRFQTASEMLAAIKLSTSVQPPPPPSKMSIMTAKLGNISRKVTHTLGIGIKHLLLSPIYLIFLPIILAAKLFDWNDRTRQHLEPVVFLLGCAMVVGYYFWGVPELAEWNLRRSLAQSPAQGTIIYYASMPIERRGFTFVDGRTLPDPQQFFVPTPEIIDHGFSPKYALSDDGTTFYFTTPSGLYRISLAEAQKSPLNSKTLVVRSEVFSYFSELAFLDNQLLARLKDETWAITPTGQLQQTTATLPARTIPTSNGNYSISKSFFNDLELQFHSVMIGNYDLSAHTPTYCWLPQTLPVFQKIETE